MKLTVAFKLKSCGTIFGHSENKCLVEACITGPYRHVFFRWYEINDMSVFFCSKLLGTSPDVPDVGKQFLHDSMIIINSADPTRTSPAPPAAICGDNGCTNMSYTSQDVQNIRRDPQAPLLVCYKKNHWFLPSKKNMSIQWDTVHFSNIPGVLHETDSEARYPIAALGHFFKHQS